MLRARLAQELRHGLIWRLSEEANPARPVLESFVRRVEAAAPEGEAWLRLENAPTWESRERMTWVVGNPVHCLFWLPDAEGATWHGSILAGCEDGTIRLWNPRNRQTRTFQGHSDTVTAISLDRDGKFFASSSRDGSVRYWSLDRGEELHRFEGHRGTVRTVALSADGRRIASGGSDGMVRLWEFGQSQPRFTLVAERRRESLFGSPGQGVVSGVNSVAFTEDGQRVASLAEDRSIRLWDVESGREILCFEGLWNASAMALHRDGQRIVTASSSDNFIRVWDDLERCGKRKLEGFDRLTGFRTPFIAIDLDAGLLFRGIPKGFEVWDLEAGTLRTRFFGHHNKHSSDVMVAYQFAESRLASGTSDGIVKVWDASEIEEPEPASPQQTEEDSIVSATSADADRYLAINHRGSHGRLIDRRGGTILFSYADGSWPDYNYVDAIPPVALSADGSRIAYRKADGPVRCVTLGHDDCLTASIEIDSDRITCVALCADGSRLVTGDQQGKLRVWDVETGSELFAVVGDAHIIFLVSISGDAKWVASWGYHQSVLRVWDVATGREAFSLQDVAKPRSLTLGIDGSHLVAGLCNHSVLFATPRENAHRLLLGHSGSVGAVAISTDGGLVVSGANDGHVRVWNSHDGRCLASFECAGPIRSLCFKECGEDLVIVRSENMSTSYHLRMMDRLVQNR